MLARKVKPHTQRALAERTVARKVAQNVNLVTPGPFATQVNARNVRHVILGITTTAALTIAIHLAAQVAH